MAFFISLYFTTLTCLLRTILPGGLWQCWGFFMHLLHCLTTSPFTLFGNDLAPVFIIWLEIAWDGMFRAKLVC